MKKLFIILTALTAVFICGCSHIEATLNQTNNFYSPEALSPAETARLNRINLRRTLQAVR